MAIRTESELLALIDQPNSNITLGNSTINRQVLRDVVESILTIAGPGAPVSSVFARTGAIIALLSDYDASQIDNDSSVTGATVKDALETLAAGGGSSQLNRFDANDALFPATDPAGGLGRNGHATLVFDDTTDENVIFEGIMSEDYLLGTMTVDIDWVARSATTGNARWGVSFERLASGLQDIDVDGFAAVRVTTSPASATNGVITRSSITFTQAQADSIAAGEAFRLKLTREASNAGDTVVGDAQPLRVMIAQ